MYTLVRHPGTPWLPEGTLMTQWAPAVIRGPLVSWAPSRQGGPFECRWPPRGRNPGSVPEDSDTATLVNGM